MVLLQGQKHKKKLKVCVPHYELYKARRQYSICAFEKLGSETKNPVSFDKRWQYRVENDQFSLALVHKDTGCPSEERRDCSRD